MIGSHWTMERPSLATWEYCAGDAANPMANDYIKGVSMMREERVYPCDGPDGHCPFVATEGIDCYNHCGLGADEDTNYKGDDDYDSYK